MKAFYINTKETCFKPNLGGGTPTSGKVFYHSYLCHGVTFIFLHSNEKEKKNKNLLIYMCVCEHKFTYKIFHENNINVRKKVILKQLTTKRWA